MTQRINKSLLFKRKMFSLNKLEVNIEDNDFNGEMRSTTKLKRIQLS